MPSSNRPTAGKDLNKSKYTVWAVEDNHEPGNSTLGLGPLLRPG